MGKGLTAGGSVVLCAKVVNIQMDESLFAKEPSQYGDGGYMYFIHRPINSVSGEGRHDGIGVIKKLIDTFTYE